MQRKKPHAACTEENWSTACSVLLHHPPPPQSWMILLLLLCVMISASDIWERDSAAPDCPAEYHSSSLNGCCQSCSVQAVFTPLILNVHINNSSDPLRDWLDLWLHSLVIWFLLQLLHQVSLPLFTLVTSSPLYIPLGPLITFLSTFLRPLAPLGLLMWCTLSSSRPRRGTRSYLGHKDEQWVRGKGGACGGSGHTVSIKELKYCQHARWGGTQELHPGTRH